jgi:uncharacterized membrane protein
MSDLIIEPDAIAVIVRRDDGKYKVTTNHHAVRAGTAWGMFWGFLFGLLLFVPVFGVAVGAGAGAIMGKLTKSGIDQQFESRVRAPSQAAEKKLQEALHGEAREPAAVGARLHGRRTR